MGLCHQNRVPCALDVNFCQHEFLRYFWGAESEKTCWQIYRAFLLGEIQHGRQNGRLLGEHVLSVNLHPPGIFRNRLF